MTQHDECVRWDGDNHHVLNLWSNRIHQEVIIRQPNIGLIAVAVALGPLRFPQAHHNICLRSKRYLWFPNRHQVYETVIPLLGISLFSTERFKQSQLFLKAKSGAE